MEEEKKKTLTALDVLSAEHELILGGFGDWFLVDLSSCSNELYYIDGIVDLAHKMLEKLGETSDA